MMCLEAAAPSEPLPGRHSVGGCGGRDPTWFDTVEINYSSGEKDKKEALEATLSSIGMRPYRGALRRIESFMPKVPNFGRRMQLGVTTREFDRAKWSASRTHFLGALLGFAWVYLAMLQDEGGRQFDNALGYSGVSVVEMSMQPSWFLSIGAS